MRSAPLRPAARTRTNTSPRPGDGSGCSLTAMAPSVMVAALIGANLGATKTERGRRVGALDGKVAIVTGGASGIGLATATRMAAEGARLVLADRNDQAGKAVAADLEA